MSSPSGEAPVAPLAPRRELTYSTRCELGGRSQAIGHFQVYYVPGAAVGLGLRDTPPPHDARHVDAYFIHHVRLQNTGDTELRETVAIQLGVPEDDSFLHSATYKEKIVQCEQVHVDPAGPQITLTVAPHPTIPELPSLTATGALQLHPQESVEVEITSIFDDSPLGGDPEKAVVRVRGPVSVVEKPWGWERQQGRPDPLERATTLARERGLALQHMSERYEALRVTLQKRVPVWVGTLSVTAFLAGFFHSQLVSTFARVFAAIATGVYWRTLLAGSALLTSSVFASTIAGIVLLRKWSVFKERWFWIMTLVGLVASVFVIHLSK